MLPNGDRDFLDNFGLHMRAGYNVVPVYTMRSGVCSCGGTCRPKNAGKHPCTPHGVNDASHDIEQGERWNSVWSDANGGFPLGDGNFDPISGTRIYCFDNDQPAVAALLKLLFTQPNAPTGFAVAESGRDGGGLHIYFRSTADQATQNLHSADGTVLGELRGTGSYTVLPPSLHQSGRRYTWIVGNLIDTKLEVFPDPRVAVLGLLRMVGMTLAAPKAKVHGDYATMGAVTELDIPFNWQGDGRLALILAGKTKITDTSQLLLDFGRCLWERAEEVQYPLTVAEVAGIIKRYDGETWRKYTNRSDADTRYWEKAYETKVYTDKKKDKVTPRDPSAERYIYGDELGLEYIRGNRPIPLANFRPQVTEEHHIILPNGEISFSYVIRCELPTEQVEITIANKHLQSSRTLQAEIQRQLPRKYLVEEGAWWRIWLAANAFAMDPPILRQFATTGWVETTYGWGFILPGANGAITADGLDERTTHFGFPDKVPQRYQLYGLGVRPAETNDQRAAAEDALRALFGLLPAEILIPILDLVLGAPLCSLGLAASVALIHIFGRTGQLKTSVALAILSLFGRFTGRNEIPEKWSSTPTSLQQALHVLRDLPLLVDDYKTTPTKVREASQLVQDYADGSVRSRMSNQDRQESLLPYALLFSTGENRWEQEQSVQARMFSLPFPELEKGSPAFKTRSRLLGTLQEHARRGDLALVGGTFLQYLAKQGETALREELAAIHARERDSEALDLAVHARIIDTLATLRTTEQIVQRFLEAEFPNLADTWQGLCDQSWKPLRSYVIEEANEAEELSPANRVLSAIRGGLIAGTAQIERRRTHVSYGVTLAPDMPAVYDDEGICLTENITWSWYKKTQLREGEKPLFDWKSVLHDGENNLGGRPKRLKEDKNRICICIPHDRAGLLGCRQVGDDVQEDDAKLEGNEGSIF